MNDIKQTAEFRAWRASLDAAVAERVRARLTRFQSGNPGDVEPVGGDVFEMRIHAGSGYRMYYTRVGRVAYFMLVGGIKRSQKGDIMRAQDMAAALRGKR